ncbi:MAG: tRNA lysidine(34) synthetase TilS, partial [Chitinophagaceae bacterium]
MKKSADKLTLQGTSLLHQFLQFIKKEELFPLKNHLLLAVSGGVDSVVLCELCKQAEFHFSIAHCNFQLRGEESNKDEQSVREMGDRYNVQVFVKDFDTNAYANDHNLSIQVAARELRYAWFQSILENDKNSIHAVLTAHHADDNIETVLMNFFKGTGMAG